MCIRDRLQAMRSNYAALKQFKENVEKNELHEKREAIVNDDKYTLLAAKNENGEYLNEASVSYTHLWSILLYVRHI